MQGSKSWVVSKFWYLTETILFQYCADISMGGVGDVLEVKGRRWRRRSHCLCQLVLSFDNWPEWHVSTISLGQYKISNH